MRTKLFVSVLALIIIGSSILNVKTQASTYAINFNGNVTELWRHENLNTGDWPLGIIILGMMDIDSDGIMDLVIGDSKYDAGATSATVIALDGANGGTLWTHTITHTGNWPSVGWASAIEKLDLDPISDVIVTFGDGSAGVVWIHALSGATGNQIWEKQYTGLNSIAGSIPFVHAVWQDVNGDGSEDLFVVLMPSTGGTGSVAALNGATGDELWSETFTGDVSAQEVRSDLNGDGKNDVFVRIWVQSTGTTTLTALKGQSGDTIWSRDFSGNFAAGLVSADLNGDGSVDMMCMSEDLLTFFPINGRDGIDIWSTPLIFAEKKTYTIMRTDITGDGVVEFLFYTYVTPPPSTTTLTMINGANGATVWTKSMVGYWTVGSLLDLTGDGKSDVGTVLQATYTPGASSVTFINKALSGTNGEMVWERSVTVELPTAIIFTSVACPPKADEDLTGDGRAETEVFVFCIAYSPLYTVGMSFILSGADGSVLWTVRMTCDALCTGPNVAPGSDFNGDGRRESLVYTSKGVYMESTTIGAVAGIGQVVSTVFSDTSVTLGFMKTGNIYDDSGIGFMYAHRAPPKILFTKTDASRVNQATGQLTWLDYTHLVTVGGRNANPTTKYYEDLGLAPITFEANATHYRFLKAGVVQYAVLKTSITATNDYLVMEVITDGTHKVIILWGIEQYATYASGIYFDGKWTDLSSLTQGWYIVRWQDLDTNGTPDYPGEFTVVASGT